MTATRVDNAASVAVPKRAVRWRLYGLLLTFDTLAIVAGFVIAGLLRGDAVAPWQGWAFAAAITPLFLAFNNRSYSLGSLDGWRGAVLPAIMALIGATGLVLLVEFYVRAVDAELSRWVLMVGSVIAISLLVIGRGIVGWLADRALPGGPMSRILIIDGVEAEAPEDVSVIRADGLKLDFHVEQPFVLDWLSRSVEGADQIFISCPPDRRAGWAAIFKGTDFRVDVLIPEFSAIGAIGANDFNGCATISVSAGSLRARDEVMKRLLDLAIVLPAILLLSPLLIAVAIAVKLDSPGPVLFRQTRVGRRNRLFSVLKFRSMRVESCDVQGARSTARDDDRITRVGRFIRATSIDELPQLLNIMLGQMSFVGPRPHALGSLAGDKLFWEIDQRYWHRHACKPGLTGLAQIRGFRGATHKREDLLNRLHADLEYVARWSVWRDISILVATFKVVVHRNAF